MLLYSLFDGNHGADGAAINLAYYNVKFDNVTFSNNVGSAVRVSKIISHLVKSRHGSVLCGPSKQREHKRSEYII